MENFNNLVSVSDVEEHEDLVDDGWTDVIRRVLLIRRQLQAEGRAAAEAHKLSELADIQQMEAIRARVDEVVQDRATAEALKPYYAYFCKRPCFHDEYLQSFNQPNVSLVDTGGKGVEAMTERGVVAGGKEYELDCLIWATGFDYGAGIRSRGVKDIYGRGGLTLDEKWAEGGATFQGLQIGGFPNLFIFHRVQTGVTTNITHMLRELARHAAYIVGEAEARGAAVVDVDPEAEAEWVAHAEGKAILRKRFFEECTPGYYNDEGQVRTNARNAPYGAGPAAFIKVLETWREAGGLAGLEFETR
jgi:cyclohexanone monooxygenase